MFSILVMNKSVASAQRRRTAPSAPSVSQNNQRGPQPSINSSHAFRGQPSESAGDGGVNKISRLTIAQAITLITLRLGKLESHILGGKPMANLSPDGEDIHSLDITGMLSRIDAIEDSISTKSTNNIAIEEFNILKQQVDGTRNASIASKTTIVALSKEVKENTRVSKMLINDLNELKQDMNALRKQFHELSISLISSDVDDAELENNESDNKLEGTNGGAEGVSLIVNNVDNVLPDITSNEVGAE